MRALRFHLGEALASLRRHWRAAILSSVVATMAITTAGAFAIVWVNARGWARALGAGAEISVFLDEGAGGAERSRVERTASASAAVEEVAFVSRAEARARFVEQFPDLTAIATGAGDDPFPMSYELRLREGAPDAAVEGLVAELRALPGVSDVQYDRVIVERAQAATRLIGAVGVALSIVLALAAAITMTSVVRLGWELRRDEVEILTLVGAPLSALRGPFVAEGLIVGVVSALTAIAALWILHRAAVWQAGGLVGLTAQGMVFLPPAVLAALVAGGAALGAGAAWLAIRRAS